VLFIILSFLERVNAIPVHRAHRLLSESALILCPFLEIRLT
jgi:hypothetical protein